MITGLAVLLLVVGLVPIAPLVQAARLSSVDDTAGHLAQGADTQISGVPVTATQSAVVDFGVLAQQAITSVPPTEPITGVVMPFMEQPEPVIVGASYPVQLSYRTPSKPDAASPAPASNYMGQDDIAAVGTGTYMIPPDTDGAVGLDRVFATLNNNYRIQNKATGATISTVSMNSFWSGTGATGLFDPKTLYDPYNNRWIVAGASNSASATSSIVVGVSNSSDPSGTWSLFRYQICATVACGAGGTDWWADYPTIGFNKNWVAISVNMFSTSAGTFQQSRLLVVNYPTLLGGSFSANLVSGLAGFTLQPAVTYDTSIATLYIPEFAGNFGSGVGVYHLHSLTGTPAAPTFNVDATNRSMGLSAFVQPSGDILPQANGSLGTDIAKINVGGSRLLNAVYRNNFIWTAHTVGLPFGGLTHTAAQWLKLGTDGSFQDGGRVEDPTATASNGGKWYAYPTLTVNQYNDVLLGFSQFSSAQWPAAGYTFRYMTDAAGTMRDPYIYKAGEGFYWKTFGGGRNRWGDYSNTQVDPVNDVTLWTIQEYSKPEGSPLAATGDNSGVWSTWWASVSPSHGNFNSITTGNWTTAGTWDAAAVPQATDIVTITSGTTVTVDSNAQALRLTVAQGGVLVIPSGVTLAVSQTLTNHGTIIQARPVSTASVSFQITDGGSGVQYRLADITTASNLGLVTVTVRALNTGEYCTSTGSGSPAYVQRCFQIAATTSSAATVRLWALTSELGTVTTPRVFRYAGASPWAELTTNASTGTSGSYTYAQSDTPGFSHFLIGQAGSAPTAVTLQRVQAQPADTRLGWFILPLLIGSVMLIVYRLRRKHTRP